MSTYEDNVLLDPAFDDLADWEMLALMETLDTETVDNDETETYRNERY